jgi:CubicO group peptidase (beta-lactamase class C family)
MAPAAEFDAVRAQVRQTLVRDSLPSMAVAVSRGDEILWEEGFGWADRENRIPATEHLAYPLASISKPITATALMVLRGRGALDLDRPLNDYLGDAQLRARVGDVRGATVRRVANHTAGLPNLYQTFYADEPDRPPAMAETIRRYGQLMTPPGERFHYSNLGYGLLGHVVARVAGTDYADFLRREVFLPLGMTHAAVGRGPGPSRAVLYGTDGKPLPPYETSHPGAADVWCSAHDLIRFGLFHLKARLPDQKPILSDEAIDEMQRPTASMGRDSYGIGWVIGPGRKGYATVRHGGGMAGAQVQLTLVPSVRMAVVVLVNADNRRAVDEVTQAILDEVLPGKPDDPRPASGAAAARPADFSKLAGTWAGRVETHQGELPLVLRVRESGDVRAQLGGQPETVVTEAKSAGDVLTGVMAGDVGTADAGRRPYRLHLDLKLRAGSLCGAVVVISLPTSRGGSMAYWTALKKE